MIINGIDVRRYGATLLTAETKPPKMTANYEMMSKALLPTEYDTDIPLGSMTMPYTSGERTGRHWKEQCHLLCRISGRPALWKKSEDSKENIKGF